jgi:hypothetical protein
MIDSDNQNPPEERSPPSVDGKARESRSSCDFWHILPVRYALCHKEGLYAALDEGEIRVPAPLGADLPHLKMFHYTLRTLRKGWVHISFGRPRGAERARYSFEFDEGRFYEVRQQKGGAEIKTATGKWIKIPKDAGMMAQIAFSPCNWDEPAWEAYENTPRYRRFFLDPQKWEPRPEYCAQISRLGELVEEFKQFPGQLHYLADWAPEVFDPAPEKTKGFADPQRSRAKGKAVEARWQDGAVPIVWQWQEGGTSDLQAEMEQACPQGSPYLVALLDPLGCAQDIACINARNMQALSLHSGYYGYPQLLAEMAERYVTVANEGTDKKQVLGTRRDREESYADFLLDRKRDLNRINHWCERFFADWKVFLKDFSTGSSPTVTNILLWDYPTAQRDGKSEKEKKIATDIELNVFAERESEFALCVKSLSSFSLGRDLAKEIFLSGDDASPQYELFEEILAGGIKDGSQNPYRRTRYAGAPLRIFDSNVKLPGNENLADILSSMRTALLDIGQPPTIPVYKNLMDFVENRVRLVGGEPPPEYNPHNLPGENNALKVASVGDYAQVLERSLYQLAVDDDAQDGPDFTKEYPQIFPNEFHEFANVASFVSSLTGCIEERLDNHYYFTMRKFPKYGTPALKVIKEFKRIALPVAIVTNAKAFADAPSRKSAVNLLSVIFGTSLCTNALATILTSFKIPPGSGMGFTAGEAAVKIIRMNTLRVIGGAGTLAGGALELRDLINEEETHEAKIAFSYACLGQLLLFSCNPLGMALGFALFIGGMYQYTQYKRDLADEWFRTAYWGKRYRDSKPEKTTPFSFAKDKIQLSGLHFDEFRTSLRNYIYFCSPPRLNIYVKGHFAYIGISATSYMLGKSSFIIHLDRVDRKWMEYTERVQRSIEERRKNAHADVPREAEGKVAEMFSYTLIRGEHWRREYLDMQQKLHQKIDETFDKMKADKAARINWKNPALYHTPLQIRIIKDMACCEMILDLGRVGMVDNPHGTYFDVEIETWGEFMYDSGFIPIPLPLPDINMKNFKATEPVYFSKNYPLKKEKVSHWLHAYDGTNHFALQRFNDLMP